MSFPRETPRLSPHIKIKAVQPEPETYTKFNTNFTWKIQDQM